MGILKSGFSSDDCGCFAPAKVNSSEFQNSQRHLCNFCIYKSPSTCFAEVGDDPMTRFKHGFTCEDGGVISKCSEYKEQTNE